MRTILRVSRGLALLSLCLSFAARAQEVRYTVSMPKPTTGMLDVVMEISNPPGETLDVAMPMWTPGGYSTAWFARNVQELWAEDESGGALQARQVGTSRWRIGSTDPVSTVRLHYRVFTGRTGRQRTTPRMDDSHVSIHGPAVFMYLIGTPPYPAPGSLTVTIDTPEGWMLATGLESVAPGVFTAPDYDTLIDAPIEAATYLDKFSFEDHGALYEITIRNPHDYDREAFTEEIRRIVSEQAEMMGGVPFDRYVFLLTGINTRGGGLEHLNSTTISFKRYDDTSSPDYQRLQFLIAHEFFHLWNVKRIRPEILGPFDYSKPQHTRNLHVSEGMTDYYGYLTVARAGLWSRELFYEELAKVIETHQSAPGHLVTSAEAASFNAWTPSDNRAYTGISYYTKGSLIGLLLDMEIRGRTENRRTLDDVFRRLLAQYGLPKPGFPEDGGFQDVVEAVTKEGDGNADFSEFFEMYVAGLEELDYNGGLRYVGLELEVNEKEDEFAPSLGLTTEESGGQITVTAVDFEGAGYEAGMMIDDIIVALDGERAVPQTFDTRIRSLGVGGEAGLLVLRGDRLITVPVRLEEDRPLEYKIVEDPDASRAAVRTRDDWLQPYDE